MNFRDIFYISYPFYFIFFLHIHLWITIFFLSHKTELVLSTRNSVICSSSQFACRDGKSCVPLKWVCDGTEECSDGSDEKDNCPSTCSPGNEFRCNSGQCITLSFKCDGSSDCEDESDELKCENRNCTTDEFKCIPDNKCIPLDWKCDHHRDCTDSSDEKGCGDACDKDEFQCKNGDCISKKWVCDQSYDCSDHSDEDNCTLIESCSKGSFLCQNKKMCILAKNLCDGDKDCLDGSDESNCTVIGKDQHCDSTEFRCESSHECIAKAWVCDGAPDCLDNSDESGPECKMKCKSHQFMCKKDMMCIHKNYRCDGSKQCTDNSDEEDCHERKCKPTEFDCNGKGVLCISKYQVCDGVNDCGDFEDETQDIKSCRAQNKCLAANCSHDCINKLKTFTCVCKHGFHLLSDNRTCDDINECAVSPGICSQICINTKGSFKCQCQDGYQLVNGSFCKAKGRPLLIIANRKDIRQMDLSSNDFRLVVSNLSNAVALDMHYSKSRIYWTDVTLSKIQSGIVSRHGNITNEETLVDSSIAKPDGLSVDWIHDLLFWTDSEKKTIEVMSLKTKHRRVLISSNLGTPRAVVTDPVDGKIYWSDWGVTAKIEGSGMNGGNRRVVISDDKYAIAWPNGLAFDYVGRKLYWMDAKLHMLSVSDVEGKNPAIIKIDPFIIHHPFGVAVFEDRLFWTDWITESIHSINKFTGKDEKKFLIKLKHPMGIQIFHSHSQNAAPNRCKNNKCDHLCLPTAAGSRLDFECSCSDGFTGVDGRCVPDHGQPVIKPAPKTTPDPVIIVPLSSKSPSNVHYRIVTQDKTDKSKAHKANISNSLPMYVAGHSQTVTVIWSLLVIVVLLAVVSVVVFIIYKRRLKKRANALNFDNPMYRKAAEEKCVIGNSPSSKSAVSALSPLAENEYV